MSVYKPYEKFIEQRLEIIDKQGQIVQFVPNGPQRLFANKATGRDILLKARQEGFSSFIGGIFAGDFILDPNSHSVVVADVADNAIGLLDKVKFYLQSYEQKTGMKIPLKYNSKYELVNEVINSKYQIGTAENTEFGRSKTIKNLHMCVGGDTKIISKNGITKKIKDIEIGDRVIAEDGGLTEVTNKWNTGIKPIKRIRLWLSNETIDVSPDHKIRVAGAGHNSRLSDPVWKKAKDLTTDDYVMWAYPKTGAYVKHLVVRNQKNAKHLVRKRAPNGKIGNVRSSGLVLKTNYKLGYFLGYYLAEGNITKDLNKISFACHPDEYFYENFIDLFPISPRVDIRSDNSGTRKIITYFSREIAMFVNDLVGRAENKYIPDKFLYQYPKKFLLGLFDGWKDGDGSKLDYVKNGRQEMVFITTIRESIGRQMRQIYCLLNHRIPALDYVENRKRYENKTQPIYRLRVHGFSQKKKNGAKSFKGMKYRYLTTRNMSSCNGGLFIKVKSIEDAPPQQTYEIEVKDKSHAFLTPCGVISNSEAAFYKHFRKLLASALQAVRPDGRVVIETTANGFNELKEFWDESELGLTGFNPLFFSASLFYSQDFLEQKRKELGRLYPQEYPETPEEAFIASGDNYFDKEALKAYLEQVKDVATI